MRLNRAQVWAYGAGDLGVAVVYVAVNTHFLYFLINVAGFTPLAAGLVFVLGRVIDAVTDPLIGRASDRLRDSLGRIPFLRRGLAPAALSCVALFALPLSPAAPLACAVLGAAVFSVAQTCVLMPYLALLPELVPDYDDRTAAIGVKSVFTMLATLLAFALPPAVVLAVSGTAQLAQTTPEAWVYMSGVLAVLYAVPLVVVAWRVPDPRNLSRAGGAPAGQEGLWAGVRSAWRTRGMPEAAWMFLAVTVAIMIANSLLTFFLESALEVRGDSVPLLLGGLVVTSIVTFPVWVYLGARVGKRAGLMLSLALEIASLLLLVTVVPAGGLSPALWAVVLLNGFAVGGVTLYPWAILPDVVELDALAAGRRREGLIYSVFTFAQKMATSVGVFANAIVIGAFGYVQGQAQQSAETVDALRWMMGPGAAAVFALAIYLTWRFPITRELHAAARDELAAVARGRAMA